MQWRSMTADDLEAVSAIEAAAAEFPWPATQFSGSYQSANDCRVLEYDGVVVGFSICCQVLDEATLLNIAVSPDAQGKGLGRYLLERSLAWQKSQGAAKCFLEVRVSNHHAQGLYQSLGFTTVGERKNYYPAQNGREDALLMSRDLTTDARASV